MGYTLIQAPDDAEAPITPSLAVRTQADLLSTLPCCLSSLALKSSVFSCKQVNIIYMKTSRELGDTVY